MDRIGAFNIKEIGFGLICGIWNGGVFLISLDGTQNKNLVVPDDGSRGAVTFDRHFPLNVLRFTPRCWRVTRLGDTAVERTPPLWPIFFCKAVRRGR